MKDPRTARAAVRKDKGLLQVRTRLHWWLNGKEFTCQAGHTGSIPGSGRSPGEGNATHSSILAWQIPWTEESGGLQSMGLQSWARLSHTHTHTHTHICRPHNINEFHRHVFVYELYLILRFIKDEFF